jgi:hypothetical protein
MKQRGNNVIKKQHQKLILEHHGKNGGGSDVQLKYYYGDAGRGTQSRMKGFLRRGHSSIIETLAQESDVFITDEYRTTKLCCLCNQPVSHPKKQDGKKNLGTVICVNPGCIGKRYGCIARSRDANASMNRILSGIFQQLLGSAPSAFSRSLSPAFIEINKILQELMSPFHPGLVEGDIPVPLSQ